MDPFDPKNKDVLLAAALASGGSSAAAARKMAISKTTVKRRLRDPAFRRLVSELRDEMLSSVLGRMTDQMTGAVEKLGKLLEEDDPAIRLRAFRASMTFGLRLRDSVDLNDRIGELEAELARKTGAAS
jgi:hypothetical protein